MNKEATIIASPPQTIIVVNFWYFIPKKITMPPPRPRKIESIPKITSSISMPKVNGVKIPESRATAPIMYAYFVPDRSSDLKSLSKNWIFLIDKDFKFISFMLLLF